MIRWWTNSKYSHCELYVDKNLIGISSNEGVRIKKEILNPNKWDLLTIPKKYDVDYINFFNKTKGKKYDWLGIILSNVFNRGIHNKNKYTCSEWLIECIDKSLNIIPEPKKYQSYSPKDVYNLVSKLK